MLKDDIQKKMLVVFKEGKKTETDALRFVLSEIKYAEINKKGPLTDDETAALLQKEVKKRKEAILLFQKGGRQDLVDRENQQIGAIEHFLPKQLSDEELFKIVDEEILKAGKEANVGKIIGAVMAKTMRKADGSRVALMVKKRLSE